jgi:hypothetical protein
LAERIVPRKKAANAGAQWAGASKGMKMATQATSHGEATKAQATVSQTENGAMPYAAALPMPNQKIETGRYGPIPARTPANGFNIIGDIKPGKAEFLRKMAVERGAAVSPRRLYEILKPLTIHYARWAIINNDTQLMYSAVFDTDFDKYGEDAHRLFMLTGLSTFFECMIGFPDDWKTNIPAFMKFFKERQCDSVFEFTSYPGATVAEIEKALAIKNAFTEILDHMQ